MRARLYPGFLLVLATACSGDITAPKVSGGEAYVHRNGHEIAPGTLSAPPFTASTSSTDSTSTDDSGHGFGSGG